MSIQPYQAAPSQAALALSEQMDYARAVPKFDWSPLLPAAETATEAGAA